MAIHPAPCPLAQWPAFQNWPNAVVAAAKRTKMPPRINCGFNCAGRLWTWWRYFPPSFSPLLSTWYILHIDEEDSDISQKLLCAAKLCIHACTRKLSDLYWRCWILPLHKINILNVTVVQDADLFIMMCSVCKQQLSSWSDRQCK